MHFTLHFFIYFLLTEFTAFMLDLTNSNISSDGMCTVGVYELSVLNKP